MIYPLSFIDVLSSQMYCGWTSYNIVEEYKPMTFKLFHIYSMSLKDVVFTFLIVLIAVSAGRYASAQSIPMLPPPFPESSPEQERIAPNDRAPPVIEILTTELHEGKNVLDRKSTRLNSSHANISYAVFCLKKKTSIRVQPPHEKLGEAPSYKSDRLLTSHHAPPYPPPPILPHTHLPAATTAESHIYTLQHC